MAGTYYPKEMYNLPYEQAKAKYGNGVGNNIHFMSKDQFEQEKARIEKQNKMAVNEGKSDWWTQPGEAEKIVERFTGKANPTKEEVSEKANEIIERRITPEQQGTLSKGNPDENKFDIQDDIYFTIKDKIEQGKNQINKIIDKITGKSDNIDDTRAIGATKEELDDMLQNGLISKYAYDKQIAALKTPEVQEAMARGEKKADETVWDPTDRDASDDDDDDDDGGGSESGPDENYKKSMMSIWDAYRAGLIDKETAGYFTIDAIATLAKNLGRSIGNVGAQFSGGTIDNGHDESKWGQRQNAVLNEEIGKETESLGGAAGRKAESESLDNQAKRIRNAYTPKQLEQQIEMFEKELEMAGINLDMAHSRTDLINFIKSDPNYANSPFKMGMVAYLTQNGVGGAVNNASSTLLDAMNWMLTIAK